MEFSGLSFDVIKILTLGFLSFVLAALLANPLIAFLYKYRLWRKEVRQKAIDGASLSFFQKFHSEGEIKTPRFGGALILVAVLGLIFLFSLLAQLTEIEIFDKLNFLSRRQTWLPLFTLVAASLLGLIDDLLQVWGKGKYIGGGLSLVYRLGLVFLIGVIGAWWFYFKLDAHTLHLPGLGNLEIDGLYLPLFVIVMMAVYSGGVVDGLDGLAGGVFATIFAAFIGIAIFREQIDLAAFLAVILGGLLAFLWHNIPPARFYMGETGVLGLTATLTVVAFLTDSVLVLPIISLVLVMESASVILQLLSKKFRKKKLFLASPIHYHFEAKGWPPHQVTMRFWLISMVASMVGVVIRLFG
jgi:phospho-N-acetylmuramoyl-pentapeptide-transferase